MVEYLISFRAGQRVNFDSKGFLKGSFTGNTNEGIFEGIFYWGNKNEGIFEGIFTAIIQMKGFSKGFFS